MLLYVSVVYFFLLLNCILLNKNTYILLIHLSVDGHPAATTSGLLLRQDSKKLGKFLGKWNRGTETES